MTITIDSIKERPRNMIQIGLRSRSDDGRSMLRERDVDADSYNADPQAVITKLTAEWLEDFEAFEKAQPEKMGEILADPEALRGSVVDHTSKAVVDAKAEIEAAKAQAAIPVEALPEKP